MYFVDSDVILDFVLTRHPFYDDACKILGSNLNIGTTALVLSNVFYISNKKLSTKDVIKDTTDLLKIFKNIPIGLDHVKASFESNFKDKEDGFQHFACLDSDEVMGIITRNVKNWKESELPVYTPKQILEMI